MDTLLVRHGPPPPPRLPGECPWRRGQYPPHPHTQTCSAARGLLWNWPRPQCSWGVPGEQSILGSVLPTPRPSSRGRAGARKSTHPQKRRFAFIEGVYNKSLCLCLLLSQIHPSPSLGLGTATHLSRLLGGASIRTGQGGSISVSLAPGPAPGSSLVLSIG